MYESGEIDKDELFELKEEIKNCKDEWLENIRMYDSPNIDLDDIWWNLQNKTQNMASLPRARELHVRKWK